MLIEEIIQRIQSLYSKGAGSTDTTLSDRHIYNKFLTLRSKLISQEAKKGQLINQWNYQPLSCVEMIEVPTHECPCIPALGIKVLRSKYKIPKPLTSLDKHLIQSIMSIDGSMRFDMTKWETYKNRVGNKYTSKRIAIFYKGGYLYTNTNSNIEAISLVGLFENPAEAYDFPSYCCKDTTEDGCIPMQKREFFIDSDMADTLIEMSATELIEGFNKGVEDLTNNSQDSIVQNSK